MDSAGMLSREDVDVIAANIEGLSERRLVPDLIRTALGLYAENDLLRGRLKQCEEREAARLTIKRKRK